MSDLVSAAAIEEAARRLPEVVVRTPLLPARWLNEAVDGTVRLKCENFQLAGSFKMRGAYTMISRIRSTIRRRGVITYSSGNHGQAVALAARFFDIPAVVVMPETAPAIKVEGARKLGAEVVLHGKTSTERKQKAEQIANRRKLNMVPPFDHADIIAGQGTVGREIMQDWPDVEAVLVPIGGGGLISGIAAWIKSANPGCRVVGVEPAGADAMRRSLMLGQPTTIESKPTIADGLMPVRPGDLTFLHAARFVDEVVTVTDEAMVDAAAQILNRSKMVAEFSGAATVAALLSGAWRPEGRRVVAVVSGGNLDPARALQLLGEDGQPRVARVAAAAPAAATPATTAAAAESAVTRAAAGAKKAVSGGAKAAAGARKAVSDGARKAASGARKAAAGAKKAASGARKAASKKGTAKKGAKKSAAKKSAAKKSAAKKSAAKKGAAKKSAAKKSAAKKSAAKK
ncbi:MAG TPA: threonine/serine dehydratase, partial [Longimicrobiales bacterium]|nr:threonine/serine dehydratase [Longimicrobiales bacterium]